MEYNVLCLDCIEGGILLSALEAAAVKVSLLRMCGSLHVE